MDRAKIIQKLLQNVVSAERASEIIGDFLETHSPSAMTLFNLDFVRLLLSFAWRPLTALLGAVVIGFLCSSLLFVKASRQLWVGPVQNSAMLSHAVQYARISAPLWAIAVFSLVRFGVRDRLWIVSALYACVSSAAVYSCWMPWDRPLVFAGLSVVVVISLSTDAMRRAFCLVAIVLALSLATDRLQEAGIGEAIRYHRNTTTIVISAVLFFFTVPLIQAASCVALHRRMIKTN